MTASDHDIARDAGYVAWRERLRYASERLAEYDKLFVDLIEEIRARNIRPHGFSDHGVDPFHRACQHPDCVRERAKRDSNELLFVFVHGRILSRFVRWIKRVRS